jgi:hypothetical protein
MAAKKTVAKKGMHKMPDGTMMKNSDMKKPTPKSTKKPKPLTGPASSRGNSTSYFTCWC